MAQERSSAWADWQALPLSEAVFFNDLSSWPPFVAPPIDGLTVSYFSDEIDLSNLGVTPAVVGGATSKPIQGTFLAGSHLGYQLQLAAPDFTAKRARHAGADWSGETGADMVEQGVERLAVEFEHVLTYLISGSNPPNGFRVGVDADGGLKSRAEVQRHLADALEDPKLRAQWRIWSKADLVKFAQEIVKGSKSELALAKLRKSAASFTVDPTFGMSVKFRGYGAPVGGEETEDTPVGPGLVGQVGSSAFPDMNVDVLIPFTGIASFLFTLLVGTVRVRHIVELPDTVGPGDVIEINAFASTDFDFLPFTSGNLQWTAGRWRFINPPYSIDPNTGEQLTGDEQASRTDEVPFEP
jgi:hypothetical protein